MGPEFESRTRMGLLVPTDFRRLWSNITLGLCLLLIQKNLGGWYIVSTHLCTYVQFSSALLSFNGWYLHRISQHSHQSFQLKCSLPLNSFIFTLKSVASTIPPIPDTLNSSFYITRKLDWLKTARCQPNLTNYYIILICTLFVSRYLNIHQNKFHIVLVDTNHSNLLPLNF